MRVSLPPQVRIYGAFYIYALAMGGLYPRIGDIQTAMGVGESALGLALIGTGTGTFLALTFAGPWVERAGHRTLLMAGIPAIGIMASLATLAPHPAALFAALLGAGLLIGSVEIVINVEADRIEHQLQRRVMSRCHAFWSFGFFSAGLIGAGARQIGLAPFPHLAGMLPLLALAAWLLLRDLKPAAARSPTAEGEAARFNLPTAPILLLVLFCLSAMLLEGAGADWSVILMRNTFDASPFVDGLAFSAGALGQAVARYFADGFIERHGPVAVARVLITLLGIGATTIALATVPAVALIGFALTGIGTSALFPLAMSAAARRTDRPAAVNVASLAQISFVAFLVGPPLLGFVAEHWSAQIAFAVCLPLVLASAWSVRALRD